MINSVWCYIKGKVTSLMTITASVIFFQYVPCLVAHHNMVVYATIFRRMSLGAERHVNVTILLNQSVSIHNHFVLEDTVKHVKLAR